MFINIKDMYRKVTQADIIKYHMYLQGFESFRDLLKKRNANGEDRGSNYELNDDEEAEVERYTNYMKASRKGKVPKKAYERICGYLLLSNLRETAGLSKGQSESSKEAQKNPAKGRKQSRKEESEKYYKPDFEELIAILSWKSRRKTENSIQQADDEKKIKTKPKKEEKEKDIRTARKAAEDAAEAFGFDREEEWTFYENQEKADKSRFAEYISKYSKDILFKTSVYSFFYNAEEYDFNFCNYYMQAPDAVKDMLYKSLTVQLREDGLLTYADEWTENCETVPDRTDSKNLADFSADVEEQWNRWGQRFIRSKEDLERLVQWVEQVSQLTRRDWECIKMYHQLCVNNKGIVSEIEYAIDWLARLAVDGEEKLH